MEKVIVLEINFISISSILVIFILFIISIYYVFKKELFGITKDYPSSKYFKDSVPQNFEELKKQNQMMLKQIESLEKKNSKLKNKIDDLKNVISDLEEHKNQLQESENNLNLLRVQKDETLAMVAHDIKNPASLISNFVNLLEKYDLSAQEHQDVISGLIQSSSHIVDLVNELANIAIKETNSFQLNKKVSNINDLVDNIVKLNKLRAESKEIDIITRKSAFVTPIEIDELKIKEVIDNFVNNAVKFSPPKSKIEVVTLVENNCVILEVKDNGFGLTEDEVMHAFEKNAKFSNKPTGNETSSGLGLWISKKIIEEHNGKVWVKSKKGLGSTFSFKIPINNS